MRLWSLHPSYLDGKGIVAAWREGLLARAVLRGATRGYRHHPQLIRFRNAPYPLSAINFYLGELATEAETRGYLFDRSKIGPVRSHHRIQVTDGQLAFELSHLRGKIRLRAPSELNRLPRQSAIEAHPLFVIRDGAVEPWERGHA